MAFIFALSAATIVGAADDKAAEVNPPAIICKKVLRVCFISNISTLSVSTTFYKK
jgi:hypothetical protein